MSELEHIAPVQDIAGETPIWLPEQNVLWWSDIENAKVHRLDPATGDVKTADVDYPITSIGRRASGGWITAAKTGLYFLDADATKSEFIVDPEADNPNCRLNDGAVDRQGRFLVASLNQQDLTAPDGSLFRLDPDGSLTKLDGDLTTANGIGFSPDGAIIYVTDMFAGRILAYDYDTDAGTVSGRRTFATIPAEDGWPDGLIVDTEGYIWSAHWNGWRVTRYNPAGEIERVIKLPVANVTCFAFGGTGLDELYITTAWFGLSDEDRAKQPLAGDLFRVKTDVKGLPEPLFAG